MSSSETILPQLLSLIGTLYEDTRGFLERTDDAQLWYNRGYANGMIEALSELGLRQRVEGLVDPDDPEQVAPHALLPWGKAFTHGRDMGRRETNEVMESDR